MLEKFSNYNDLKWHAAAGAQFIGAGDEIQINPDIENFRLERFQDLRSRSKLKDESHFKVMLIDNRSKTNIFIDGPDSLVDILLTKLPSYIDQPWHHIVNISLGKSFLSCENFLVDNKCNPWVIDKLELKEIKPGQETPYFNSADLMEVDKICTKCDKFLEKK